ncbi:hypothetical protein MERGE_002813 [Pneumocystis wakefieldiae]|uniref:LSM2-LSM8 complex subunit LSM8 n=1 Tax=Pneumocystis wakefieldiae TaxID=38082 RepID=A0A899FNE2_9ASCO|nr:hypothetical protein MERGE_002813 [Pneumocystis wakefieldiae]
MSLIKQRISLDQGVSKFEGGVLVFSAFFWGQIGDKKRSFVNQQVVIITSDGRVLTGNLTGFDQTINLILCQVDEKLFSMEGTQITKVDGVYLVRGDNIYEIYANMKTWSDEDASAVIGLIDHEIHDQIDWTQVKAEGIKPTKTY